MAGQAEPLRPEVVYEIDRVGDVQGQRMQTGTVAVQKAPRRTGRADRRRHGHERDVSDEQQSEGHFSDLAPLPHPSGEHVLVPPDRGVEVVDHMADVEYLTDVEHVTMMMGPDGWHHPRQFNIRDFVGPDYRRRPVRSVPTPAD